MIKKYYHNCIILKKYVNNIIIKGKVNPYEELASANIYFYYFKRHSGTFAFPMSLYESLQVGTPVIGPNLDGVKEYISILNYYHHLPI